MTEIGLSARARLIGGARFESDQLTRRTRSRRSASPVSIHKNWNDVLPSLALNVQLTDEQQLRLSVSRTLARPEYRELAPIKSRDVLNGDDVLGNDESAAHERRRTPTCAGSGIRASGEILSVGLFAKQFDESDRARVSGGRLGHARRVLHERRRARRTTASRSRRGRTSAFIAPALDRFRRSRT